MSSPFQTSQEFLEVEGPLYTFDNNPFWLLLFLIFSVVIFFWFIYASYKINGSKSTPSNPAVTSVLLVTSLLSLAQSAYISSTNKIEAYWQKNSSKVFIRQGDFSQKIARKTASPRNYYSSRTKRSRFIRKS